MSPPKISISSTRIASIRPDVSGVNKRITFNLSDMNHVNKLRSSLGVQPHSAPWFLFISSNAPEFSLFPQMPLLYPYFSKYAVNSLSCSQISVLLWSIMWSSHENLGKFGERKRNSGLYFVFFSLFSIRCECVNK